MHRDGRHTHTGQLCTCVSCRCGSTSRSECIAMVATYEPSNSRRSIFAVVEGSTISSTRFCPHFRDSVILMLQLRFNSHRFLLSSACSSSSYFTAKSGCTASSAASSASSSTISASADIVPGSASSRPPQEKKPFFFFAACSTLAALAALAR